MNIMQASDVWLGHTLSAHTSLYYLYCSDKSAIHYWTSCGRLNPFPNDKF